MNKKAFTTVEMILTILLVVVIMATITSVTLVYRDKSEYEENVTEIENYKNTLTKIIYDDILDETNPVTSITENNNTYTLVRSTNPITLEIININTTTDHKIGIKYDGVDYLVPGCDRGLVSFEGVDLTNTNDIYNMNINFSSRKYEKVLTIHFVVSNT